jgi:4'-phosphopantetheinyl transferase
MAEMLRKQIDEHTLYAIWQISESVEELWSAIILREEEEVLYRSFVAESRKKQWLAYRLLVSDLLRPDNFPIEYNEGGKPFLAGSDFHISVTHTEDLAAVIISRNAMVGIDMEKIRPRVAKVKDRFLNPAELASINKDRELEQLTLAWCAKEALYKLYGDRNLDFRENILVEIPSRAGSFFKARIRRGGKENKYRLFSEKIGDFILVYSAAPLI